jgi:hypothetical protein
VNEEQARQEACHVRVDAESFGRMGGEIAEIFISSLAFSEPIVKILTEVPLWVGREGRGALGFFRRHFQFRKYRTSVYLWRFAAADV